MSDQLFQQIDESRQSHGDTATIEKLIQTLTEQKEYHKLFEAKLLKAKHELGLPLARPTSFDDVPEEKREEFEKAYIQSARDVGNLLLDEGKITEAWVYHRTIREPERVRQALDGLDPQRDADEETDELLGVALNEGDHPVKGLEIMLHTHGTCNTVTTLDQIMPQLPPEDRKQAAALLVNNLYEDLFQTLHAEVEQRMAFASQAKSLRELLAGRDWLFEGGNYHIDVSHLNAVVRFARSLDADSPNLPKAIELAEYGSRLDPQFQYAGDPPFEDFYRAHLHYLKILEGSGREEGLDYFREKLNAEPDEQDKQLIAYVIVDLLTRIGEYGQALELAEPYLGDIEDPNAFSFAGLCQQAGRMDVLERTAKQKGDLIGYTAALIQKEAEPVGT